MKVFDKQFLNSKSITHGVPVAKDRRWRITPEAIVKVLPDKQYKPSVMVLNYPDNPDGLTYTEAELKALAKCAREFDILVILDEIYGLFDHAFAHRSFANYYPAKTITTTGLSNTIYF